MTTEDDSMPPIEITVVFAQAADTSPPILPLIQSVPGFLGTYGFAVTMTAPETAVRVAKGKVVARVTRAVVIMEAVGDLDFGALRELEQFLRDRARKTKLGSLGVQIEVPATATDDATRRG